MNPEKLLKADLILDARAELGEGPIWDAAHARLYWVDILDSALHAFDPATGTDRKWDVGSHVGTVVPHARGGVVLALKDHIATFDPEKPGKPVASHRPPRHPANNRFNDGKCAPDGRLWVGTMAYDIAKGAGTLWRCERDGSMTAMIDHVTISNGLVWDLKRRRFYYIDTPTRTIAAYTYDPEHGSISDRRVVVTSTEEDGFPDGMVMDEEGKLWVAHWGKHQVICWDPDTGRALRRIHVPVPQPSACAFGGAKLDRLYITTARQDMTADQLATYPQSGGIYVVDVGVRGRPPQAFTG